ncbi:MAG: sensor histidine kinase [Thermodesulfobacteriota bacterium]
MNAQPGGGVKGFAGNESRALIAAAGCALLGAAAPRPWSLALAVAACWAAWLAFRSLRFRLDASDRRQCALDEQLCQSQKLAAIGEIASGVAHEINNPLAVITQESEWLAHLLASQPLPLDDARSSLRTIQAQTTRCGDITRSLLDLARAWKPIRQEADISRLAEDMAKLVEREAGPRNISIRRDYAPGLPPVPLDPPLCRQAVLNLLVNAVQAVKDGGAVTVSTGLDESGKAYIRVADNGPGIPPEHLSRVFDPFFTTKPPGKGTGLGLSITHRIVDRMGGTVTAANRAGGGAVFTITLPASGRGTQS